MKLLLLFVFVLVGCDINTKIPEKADWEKAPIDYRCTDEQMTRVHAQAQWCSENTSYYRTYCYGTAFIRNCTKAEGK
jgi:hypothetical protein